MLPTAASLEGRPVPTVTFKTRDHNAWCDVTSAAVFANRTVVVVGLPGAFTPTCSDSHLPRYHQLAKALKENGVDEIVCIAVNDAFVLDAWQNDLRIRDIRMLPDGNGEFTVALGLLVDKSKIGLGKRAWRYAMLVKNGVIAKAFIEPEQAGDPLTVSDADTMLHWINPKAVAPEPMVMFAKPGCPYCAKARALLDAHGCVYDELTQGSEVTASTLRAVSGHSTWPQVFIGGKLIGGSDDLAAYFAAAKA